MDYLEAIERGVSSDEVRVMFSGSDRSRRIQFVQSLEEATRSLRRFNLQLSRKEKQKLKAQFGITPGETYQDLINRLCRKGKYLEIPASEEIKAMPFSTFSESYLEELRDNIDNFGEDALAHLLLRRRDFLRLSAGVELVEYGLGVVSDLGGIGTISKLKEVMTKLDSGLRGRYLRSPSFYGNSAVDSTSVNKKLAEWLRY